MYSPPSVQFIADCQAHYFPQGVIRRVGSIAFTPDDLAHALFTTGRAPGDQFLYGATSVWEFLHRASLIPAYIRRNQVGRLVRSRLALTLDRSEKVAVSYALGQALTGIFCRRLLSVQFLMHVDRYADRYNIKFGNTRQRADLFGLRAQGWIVAEAKGRSNSIESDLPQKLISQKGSVLSIENRPPSLALGCVTSFPPRYPALRVDAFDPESGPVEPISVPVDLDRFILAYYEPFIAALDTGEAEEARDAVSTINYVQFQSSRLRVGLLRAIEDRVRLAIRGELRGLGSSILSLLATAELSETTFPDGTTVETDWEDSLTLNDWQA
jgi:hypothetical protein